MTLQLILTIIVGFVLGVIVLVLALFLLARWWIKRKIKSFTQEMVGALGPNGQLFDFAPKIPMPPRVHLQKCEGLAWRNAAEMAQHTEQLQSRGFLTVGDYALREMPGVLMRVLHDPTARYYAVIYDHAIGGFTFIDLHARLQSGGTLTVTNAPQGEEIRVAPDHAKIYLRDTTPVALCERMESELSLQSTTNASVEAFVEEFERSYAQSMDFQMQRGGPTLEEIRRGAQLRGETVDESTLRATHQATQTQYALMLENALHAEVLESNAIPASEWEKVRDYLIIIHEKQTPDRIVSLAMSERVYDEDGHEDETGDDVEDFYEQHEAEARQLIRSLPPRAAFERLIEWMKPSERPRKLLQLHEPVEADIYASSRANLPRGY